MNADYFVLRSVESWGDYWHVLIAGLAGGRVGKKLHYSRTGPFVPPIVEAGIGNLIVTQVARDVISALPGVTGFVPVVKEKIVRLDWSGWQRDGDEPELIRFHEPEDSILSGQNDVQLSAEVGELYEVLLEIDGLIDEDFDANGDPIVQFLDAPSRQLALFKATTIGGSGTIVAARQFLSRLSPSMTQWLQLTPVAMPNEE